MNLKSVFLGALVTLFVTIVGGIGVYYFTKEEKPKEDLQYTIDPTVDFTSSDTSVLIQNIQLVNKGTALSENITFLIELNSFEFILNKSISFSSGNSAKYTLEESNTHKLNIEVASLLPNEKIKVTLLVKSINKALQPKINIRSKTALGIEHNFESVIKEETFLDKINKYFSIILPILFALQIIVILPSIISNVKSLFYNTSTVPLNNSAFLLLHKNQTDEAYQILLRTLTEKGGNSNILSNYALSLSKKGKFDKAYKFIEAADFYSSNIHEKAVVFFNKGLIELLDNKITDGEHSIKKAISLSEKSINKYLQFSDIVKDLRNNPEIDKIFK